MVLGRRWLTPASVVDGILSPVSPWQPQALNFRRTQATCNVIHTSCWNMFAIDFPAAYEPTVLLHNLLSEWQLWRPHLQARLRHWSKTTKDEINKNKKARFLLDQRIKHICYLIRSLMPRPKTIWQPINVFFWSTVKHTVFSPNV